MLLEKVGVPTYLYNLFEGRLQLPTFKKIERRSVQVDTPKMRQHPK